MKIRILIGVMLIGVIVALIVVVFAMQRSSTGVMLLQHSAPALLPSSQLARNLESTDTDLVRESLALLGERRDPVAADKAVQLLASPDDYIWLNAAEYLGAIGRGEAVPYLIKAFRHTAWRSEATRLSELQQLTAQSFPADFHAWSNWWATTYSDATFDFETHLGPIPRR
jgi:hypothetical protein